MAITIKTKEDLKQVRTLLGAFDNGTTKYSLSLRYDTYMERYEVIDRVQRRVTVDEKGDLVVRLPNAED